MKINKTTMSLIALGMISASSSALAADLQAWSGQTAQGENPIEVIYNGKIYKNVEWVGPETCPATKSGPQNSGQPWLLIGDATKEDMTRLGNPTTCSLQVNGEATNISQSKFDPAKAYAKGDITEVKGRSYRALQDIAENSFAPGEINPWVLYAPVAEWDASKAYSKGQRVKVGGIVYEAYIWTQNNDPSIVENQNNGVNGKYWNVVGPEVSIDGETFAKAPELVLNKLYEKDALIIYKGKNYTSLRQVQQVKPDAVSPWQAFINWKGTQDLVGKPLKGWPAHVFAPYVDFTRASNDIPDMAAMAKNYNVNHFVLAFLVAKNANECMPSWGSAYEVNNYEQYSNIKALRAQGGDVMVSFGGANGTMLATACKSDKELKQYYSDIVDNLNLKAIDFDIEGNGILDKESYTRRNKVLSELQAQWKKEGRDVSVWFTVAVLPTGMTDAQFVVQDADAQGVKLDGLNLMTMDYGAGVCPPSQGPGANVQAKCSTDAVDAVYEQVKGLKMFSGMSKEEVYAHLGTTPMIGGNDQVQEILYPSDAKQVLQHAKDNNLGMVSMWSLIRDKPGTGDTPSFNMLTEEEAPAHSYVKIFAPFTQNGSVVGEHRVTARIADMKPVDGLGTIVLDGSKSDSRDGSKLAYQWKQISGSPVQIANANTATASFSVAQPPSTAHYSFSLTVTNVAAGTQDTTQTTVVVDTPNKQVPPGVMLEKSYSVYGGKNLSITAKANDFYGEELTYQWAIPDGTTLVGDSNSNTIEFTVPELKKSENLRLTLQVTNAKRNLTTKVESVVIVKVDDIASVTAWNSKKNYDGKCKAVSYKGKIWYNAFWVGAGVEPGSKPDIAGSAWRSREGAGCK